MKSLQSRTRRKNEQRVLEIQEGLVAREPLNSTLGPRSQLGKEPIWECHTESD